MRTVTEHGYTTYPRRFDAYKWFKPILVGLICGALTVILTLAVNFISKLIFGNVDTSTGYDGMDFFTAGGAFSNSALAVIPIPCLIIAALIVKDRPVSSYFSSMGGWRWKVFFKTLAVSFVILGIPTIISHLLHGRISEAKFTIGGFIVLTLLAPLQGVAEELIFRGYITQTFSSWFKLPIVGILVQIVLFAVVHPYKIVGIIEIVISALLYALICVYSKGLEAPSAMHIVNNMTEIYLAGIGFGLITAEVSIPDTILNLVLKVLFFGFILFADKKLHWFDQVKKDDVAIFNAKRNK